jgi:hypothetical protein
MESKWNIHVCFDDGYFLFTIQQLDLFRFLIGYWTPGWIFIRSLFVRMNE